MTTYGQILIHDWRAAMAVFKNQLRDRKHIS